MKENQKSDLLGKDSTFRRYILYAAIVFAMGFMYTIMDVIFYPEVDVLQKEHITVGIVVTFLTVFLCALLETLSRRGSADSGFSSSRLGVYTWFLAGFWTVIIIVSLTWNISRQRQETLEVALNEARTIFAKDLIYYRWASEHNGVFVPVTERTRPNPYLADIPGNMITTNFGKFTLVNPEYMIRQIYEMQTTSHGVRGHITSLDPIREENAADDWETKALEAFEDGETEVHSIESIEGEPYLRLMRPMITEENCLKCHAPQGYELGDIRGGISVSLPMSLLFSIYKKDMAMFSVAHLSLLFLGIIGIFSGSRRIKESIHEREEAEARIRSIIENMIDGLITLDEHGTIDSLNASASMMFGYESLEVVGQNIKVLLTFPPDRSKPDTESRELHMDIKQAIGTPKEVVGRRKDGSTFPLEISLSEMTFGASQMVIAMVRDITEEKIKKAEALRAGQLAAIGEIAAGVAHEINNPINGIINLTQILLDILPEKIDEDDSHYEILNRIISEGDRISGIVRNLLDFARQRDEIVEEYQIEDVIRDSVSLLMYQFNKDGIKPVIDISTNLPYLRGNPQQLQQVFLNLLSNARYSLNVRYKGQDSGKRLEICSFVVTNDGKDFIRTTVTDYGTGIPQEELDKIFDPLYSTKPPGEGTGLGLSISQNLVMGHQGYLHLESTFGDHTTAIVDLPVPIGS